MRRKITACILLVVMLVGLFGSVSVYALTVDDIDISSYKYEFAVIP